MFVYDSSPVASRVTLPLRLLTQQTAVNNSSNRSRQQYRFTQSAKDSVTGRLACQGLCVCVCVISN